MLLVCSFLFQLGLRGKGYISVLLASRCDTSGAATSFFGLVGDLQKLLTWTYIQISHFVALCRYSLPLTKQLNGQIVCIFLRPTEIHARCLECLDFLNL